MFDTSEALCDNLDHGAGPNVWTSTAADDGPVATFMQLTDVFGWLFALSDLVFIPGLERPTRCCMRRAVLNLILLGLLASACASGSSVPQATDPVLKASATSPMQTTTGASPSPESVSTRVPTSSPPSGLGTPTAEEATPVLTATVSSQMEFPAGPLMIEGLQAIQLIGDPQAGDIFYALTPTGLFITQNGGLTWSQVTPAPLQDAFAFSPAEPGVLYAGAGADCFRGGPDQPFYKSINGGATWSELPSGTNLRPVAVHPSDSNQIWAIGCTGPAHSLDGGITWTTSSDDLFLIYNASFIVPVEDDWSVVYFGGVSEGGSGVIAISRNGGENWTPLLRESEERLFWWISDLVVLPFTPHKIFTIDPHGLWRSRDGGSSWDFLNAGLENVVYRDGADFTTIGLNALAVDRESTPHVIYMGTAQGVYQSPDEGETWVKLQGVPWEDAPVRNLAISPTSSKPEAPRLTPRLFVTTEHGVYVFQP